MCFMFCYPLCFMFPPLIPDPKPQTLIPVPFHFTSHSPCSISASYYGNDPMPIFHDPDMLSLMLIHSELHVCFLSLKST